MQKTTYFSRLTLGLLISLSLFFSLSLKAQTCCNNQAYQNPDFETVAAKNAKFPNATITTVNNSTSLQTAFTTGSAATIGGFFIGTSQSTATPGYLVVDATRASSGSQFWYLPKVTTATTAGNSVCLQTPTLTNNTTCNTSNLKVGKRYILSLDYAPFNIAVPAGGTGTSQPVFEIAKSAATAAPYYRRLTFFSNAGTAIPAETAVAWSNVATSWKKASLVFTVGAGENILAYSILETNTCGIFFDNSSLVELNMTASGIGPITCSATSNQRVFTLNPVSNVGNVPNLIYRVTAPAGYTVAPTQGIYGRSTTFTLSKTVGSAIGTGSVNITLTDAVNTECSLIQAIADAVCFTCTPIAIGPSTLPTGTVGQPYSAQVTASGGTAPYQFLFLAGTSGPLPTGLTMNSSGLISGTPTTAGSFQVKVKASDANSCMDSLDPVFLNIALACIPPTTSGLATATQATCTNGIANTDAHIDLTGLTNGDRYSYSTTGTTGFDYNTATSYTGSSITVSALANPATPTNYIFRLFNGSNTCFTDVPVTLQALVCPAPCTSPNCLGVNVVRN
jgi:hypothetical protein